MAESTVQIVISARDQASQIFRQVEKSTATFAERTRRNFERVRVSINKLSSTARWAFLGLSASMGGAVYAAAALEKQLANVSTMLDSKSLPIMEQYKDAIQKMSIVFGESTQTLSKGLYDILSASIPPNKALGVLAVSAKAAAAGLTDTGVAADAITTVLNAYGYSAEMASVVSDKLFAIIKRGKTTFAELAPSIGNVAATAAKAGLSLDELGAAIATLTRAGIKTDEAITAVNGVLRVFLKAQDQAKEMARKYGVELTTQTLKTKGLLGVMRELNKIRAEDLALIFPEIRGLKGITAALGDAKGYMEDYKLMTESTGLTQEAFEKQTRTLIHAFNQLKESARFLAVQIGELYQPTVLQWIKDLTGWAYQLGQAIKALTPEQKEAIVQMTLMGGAVLALIGSLSLFGKVAGLVVASGSLMAGVFGLLLSPIGLLTAGIVGLAALWVLKWDEIKDAATKAWEAIKKRDWRGLADIVIMPVLRWGSEKLDSLADWIRKNLGIDPDVNNRFDLGDVKVILEGLVRISWEGLKFVGKKIDSFADWVREKLGMRSDKNQVLDWGDIKVIGKAIITLSWEGLKLVGKAIDSFADWVREKLSMQPDKNQYLDLGDIKVIGKAIITLSWEGLKLVGRAIDSFADWVREKLGMHPDRNQYLDWGDIKVIGKAVITLSWEGLKLVGRAIDSFADWVREKLGMRPDRDQRLDFGDIRVIGEGIVRLIWTGLQFAGEAIDDFADWVRKQAGLPEDENKAFDLGDVKVIVRVVTSLIWAGMRWGLQVVDVLADWCRRQMGLPEDENEEFDLGDVRAILAFLARVDWKGVFDKVGKTIADLGNWIRDKLGLPKDKSFWELTSTTAVMGILLKLIWKGIAGFAGTIKEWLQQSSGLKDPLDLLVKVGKIFLELPEWAKWSIDWAGDIFLAVLIGKKIAEKVGKTKIPTTKIGINILLVVETFKWAYRLGEWLGQLDKVKEPIQKKFQEIFERHPELLEENVIVAFGKAMAILLVEGLAYTNVILPKKLISWIGESVSKAAPEFFKSGIDLAASLMRGLGESMKNMGSAFVDFIKGLIDPRNWGKVSELVDEFLRKIGEVRKALPQKQVAFKISPEAAQKLKEIQEAMTELEVKVIKASQSWDRYNQAQRLLVGKIMSYLIWARDEQIRFAYEMPDDFAKAFLKGFMKAGTKMQKEIIKTFQSGKLKEALAMVGEELGYGLYVGFSPGGIIEGAVEGQRELNKVMSQNLSQMIESLGNLSLQAKELLAPVFKMLKIVVMGIIEAIRKISPEAAKSMEDLIKGVEEFFTTWDKLGKLDVKPPFTTEHVKKAKALSEATLSVYQAIRDTTSQATRWQEIWAKILVSLPESWRKVIQHIREGWNAIMAGMDRVTSAWSSTINEWIQGGMRFRDFITGMFDDIKNSFLNLVSELLANWLFLMTFGGKGPGEAWIAAIGGITGLAKGGYFPEGGVVPAQEGLYLKHPAILAAETPSSRPEWVLPDRKLREAIREEAGGGNVSVVFNINALDAKSVDRCVRENRDLFEGIIVDAIRRNSATRGTIRRYAGVG